MCTGFAVLLRMSTADSHPMGEGCPRRAVLGVTGHGDTRSEAPGLRNGGERRQEVLPAQQPALEGTPPPAFRKGKNKPPNSERFLRAERDPCKRSLPLGGTHPNGKLNDGVSEPHPRWELCPRFPPDTHRVLSEAPLRSNFPLGSHTHAARSSEPQAPPCFGPEFLFCFLFLVLRFLLVGDLLASVLRVSSVKCEKSHRGVLRVFIQVALLML